MAFPTNANQVQAFAGALYGMQIGSTTLAQVTSDIQAAGGLNNALNAYYTASFGASTTAAVGASVAANLGLTGQAATDAAAYITAVLNGTAANARGAAIEGVLNTFSTLTSNATFGAAATAWNNKVSAAVEYGTTSPGNAVFGAASEFNLTAGKDQVTGTSVADVFNAFLAGNGNTFQSGDKIDGGLGADTLNAEVNGAANAVAIYANTSSIETVNVTALSNPTDGGNNTTAGSTINAGKMTGVTNWGDVSSTANLVIENIQLPDMASGHVTGEVTFTVKDTLPGQGTTGDQIHASGVNFAAYFDPQSLRVGSPVATTTVTIAAGNSAAGVSSSVFTATPQLNLPYTGFAIVRDGALTNFLFSAVDAAALNNPTTGGTQAQLTTAITNAVAAYNAAHGTTIAVTTTADGYAYTSSDNIARSVTSYTLTEVSHVLTPPTGAQVGWLAANGMPAITASTAEIVAGDTSSQANLITANLVLDNAGRGASLQHNGYAGFTEGASGDVVIGSEATSGGVQDFEVKVNKGSWINSLSSTNNTLQVVNIKNGDTAPTKANGGTYVEIGRELPATGSAYDLTSFTSPGLFVDNNGLTDVQVINASGFTGSTLIGESITTNSIAKYLTNSLGTVNFAITLGNNADGITVPGANTNVVSSQTSPLSNYVLNSFNSVNLDIAAGVASAGNFAETITGGTGNDYIYVALHETGAAYTAQKGLKNITIAAKEGDNLIAVTSGGSAIISAGAGNDAYFLENGAAKGDWFTKNATATTTYTYNHTATADMTETVKVSYLGISVTAKILSSAGSASHTFSTADVNNAIALAVNHDPILSKVLKADLSTTGAVVHLTSLVDGVQAAPVVTFADGTGTGTGTSPSATLAADFLSSSALVAGASVGVPDNGSNDSTITDTGSTAYTEPTVDLAIGGKVVNTSVLTSSNTTTGANVIVLPSDASTTNTVNLSGTGVSYLVNVDTHDTIVASGTGAAITVNSAVVGQTFQLAFKGDTTATMLPSLSAAAYVGTAASLAADKALLIAEATATGVAAGTVRYHALGDGNTYFADQNGVVVEIIGAVTSAIDSTGTAGNLTITY